ncbi:MAG TPA: hypothetical protein VJB70_05070 [Candidatus Paceibacterota bacterium]
MGLRSSLENKIEESLLVKAFYRHYIFNAPAWAKQTGDVLLFICGLPFLAIAGIIEEIFGDNAFSLILFVITLILFSIFMSLGWLIPLSTFLFFGILWFLTLMNNYNLELKKSQR